MNGGKILKVIIIVATIISLVCVGIFLFGRGSGGEEKQTEEITDEQTEEEPITPSNWFDCSTIEDVKSLIEKTEAEYETEFDYVYVFDVPFGNGEAQYNYRVNGEGNISESSVYYQMVKSEPKDGEYVAEDIEFSEFKDRLYGVFNCIDNALGTRIENQYSIFSSDGTVLDSSDEKSLEKVAAGEAELELRIRDTDGSIWILSISKEYGYNDILCTFRHYSATSEQAKSYCNMAVGD